MLNLHGGNFNGGDTVLIRFRLFSDPFANGWGWAIDNLEIQGNVSGIYGNPLDNASLSVYPNPTSNLLTVRIDASSIEKYYISLHSIDGKLIKELPSIQTNKGENIYDINLSNIGISKGIYLLEIKSNNQHKSIQIIKE